MNRPFFFKKQKNGDYIQKRSTIYRPIQKKKKGNVWWNQNLPPLLWRRAIIQHSVSWRWIGTSVYTEASSHFCTCRIIQLSQTELAVLWLSSFSIFPARLHELQLLMSRLQQQFLRSQQWRVIQDFPMRNRLATYRKYHNEHVFPPSNSVQCLLSRLLSSSDLSLHKSKPRGDMKKTNIKKRKLNPEMKKLEVSNTPQSILPSWQYSL